MSKSRNKEKRIPELITSEEAIQQIFAPSEYRTHYNYSNSEDIKQLISLINERTPEKEIDKHLASHKELVAFILKHYTTGNHHSWIIPKRTIKTKFSSQEKGMIPDYIIGGQSTSGIEWFLLELKGADTKWFVETQGEMYFSNIINKGIHQIIEYLHYCDKNQVKFRDEYKLKDFTSPKAILIAGRRDEFENNPRKKDLKKMWDNLLGKRVNLITYDTFLSGLNDGLLFKDLSKNETDWDEYNPLFSS